MPFGYFVEVSPGHPGNELPGQPVRPGNELPSGGIPGHDLPQPPPGVWPPPNATLPIVPAPPTTPPGAIWPPPGSPDRPSNELPGQPVRPGNALPSGKFWVVAGIPGYGWRYICVDPSLVVDNTLPPEPVPEPKV